MITKLNIFFSVYIPRPSQVFSVLHRALHLGKLWEWGMAEKNCISTGSIHSSGKKSYYLLKALHVSFILFNLYNFHSHEYHTNVRQKDREEGTA